MTNEDDKAFSVGDNVLVKDPSGGLLRETPGVVVGYIVRFPDSVDSSSMISSSAEMEKCPKVYNLFEVMPQGATLDQIMSAELNTIVRDTIRHVLASEELDDPTRHRELKMLAIRANQLEDELKSRKEGGD